MNNVTLDLAATDVAASPGGVVNRQGLRIMCYLLLMAMDLTALALAFLVPHLLYIGPIWSGHGVVMTITVIPLFIGVSLSHHAYRFDVLIDTRTGIARVLRSFLFAAVATILIAYAMKAGASFSRFVFLSGVGGALFTLPIFRWASAKFIRRILAGMPYSVLVVVDDIPYTPEPGDFLLFPEKFGFDPASFGPYELDAFAAHMRSADRALVACSPDRYALWASILKGLAIQGEIVTDANKGLGIIGLHWHGKMQTIQVSARPMQLTDRLLKRLLDLVVASIAIVLLSPVLLAAAIAIRLESRGPILFIQARVGRDNRLFKMYKFRSMYTEKCDVDAGQLTLRNDVRVTRVGQLIRRVSIDELPQLFNVVKGDMSMVGPRPHALSAKAADKLYWDVDPRYRHRHSIKPGITGLAQVRGHRGNTERTEDLTNRLQADLEYLANWSIWRDIAIIFQTLGVLRHDNAF